MLMQPPHLNQFDSKTQRSLGEEATELVLEWLNNTTSHGIPNIVRARNMFIRILWIIFFVGSLSYCMYIIVKSAIGFLEYETIISTDYVRETPTNFPAVTFCNLNQFNEYYARNFILKQTMKFEEMPCLGYNIYDMSRWSECFNTSNGEEVFNDILDRVKRSIANRNLSDDDKFFYSFDLYYDMLISCEFNGEKCHGWYNFTKFWHNEYGFCYTFNGATMDSVHVTSESGPEYGLKMELLVQMTKWPFFSYRNGIYLLVHNQSTPAISMSNAISIRTGAETFVGIERKFIKKQEHPYSDCIKDLTPFSPFSNTIFGYFADFNLTVYDQGLCTDFCYQDKLMGKCNCSSLVTRVLKNVPYCETYEQVACEQDFEKTFIRSNTNEICENVCREQCESQEFKLTTSSAFFPTYGYRQFLSNIPFTRWFFTGDVDSDRILAQENILKITINYAEHSYMVINENAAVTWETLLGNVGGQLGLFIGISLLSFIEILEILSELFLLVLYRRCGSRHQEIVNPSIGPKIRVTKASHGSTIVESFD